MTIPFLSLLLGLPLLGVLFIAFIPSQDERNIRSVALWITSVTFLLSLILWLHFDPYNPEFQFVERYSWIKSLNIAFALGVDGLSIFFVLLTTFLMPLVIVASQKSITHRVREYMLALLVLESFLIGSFTAIDLIVFYIFFEAVLVPMFFIIGLWGGHNRFYACFKFFLYTLAGSILMLLAIAKIYNEASGSAFELLFESQLRPNLQLYLWLAFFIAFAIKIPMWPLHTWLPDAHVEAPTGGSALLAGIMLKMGGYGMMRLMLPMLPYACQYYAPYVFVLSSIAIVYTSLVAFAQSDIKKLIAYSSIAHMGYVTLGIFTFTTQGLNGAILQMLSHGLISAALFISIGMMYERFHTRDINQYGGLATVMPHLSFFFMVFTFGSIGLPGTSGFLGEFFTLIGAFQVNTTIAVCAALGMVLGAVYMLWLYKRLCFGKPSPLMYETPTIPPFEQREYAILTALAVSILLLGIYPKPVTDVINRHARGIVEDYYTRSVKSITVMPQPRR